MPISTRPAAALALPLAVAASLLVAPAARGAPLQSGEPDRVHAPPATSATDDSAAALHAALRAYRERHEAEILRELADFLAIPNVAADTAGIARNVEALRAMLARRGIESRVLPGPSGASPAVYGELRVPGARRTVMLYAHYDGQPVIPEQWATPAWTPTLRDAPLDSGGRVIPLPPAGARPPAAARLYARSASDDKGPIVAMLTALDALRASGRAPGVNLKFFFEGEEEAGSEHLQEVLARNAALLAADVWLFADGPRHASGAMQVVYGARGVLGAQLTVYGPARPLHSGHYGNWAPNPAAMLARLLASMRDDEGRVTIPGFADSVRAPTDADRAAVAAMPNTEAELAASLALGRTEGGGERLPALLLAPAMNVTGLRAGGVGAQTANAIPATATAALDFRLVPAQTPDGVRHAVEAHLRARGWHVVHEEPSAEVRRAHARVARLDWGEGYRGVRTDLALPVARAVAQVVGEAVDGPVVRLPILGGSLPLAHFEDALHVPLVVLPTVNADNNQHAANENLRLQNLWEAVEIFGQLMGRLGAAWR
ncbi:MAG TPA: M20/M25/M40 family metallo-hydrolase [Gemmatimonadaceae bacterium]|nr:M20/M25/M40 family metallo-hydrolase [Gemmatimonadaceae bacterium]